MKNNNVSTDLFLVIGSNSFSGAAFVHYLLNQGHGVIGISRSEQPHPVFLPYVSDNQDQFSFFQLDLNTDLDEIMDLINERKPKYVVNFAAQSMVAQSWDYPDHWYMTNTVSMVQFHDHLRRCDFLKKYVHISTPEVYGNCSGLVSENVNYEPSTPYAISRAAADMSLMSFYKAYNFPVVFTRAANVYGPSQQLYRIIPRTILYFLLGRPLELHGGGHSVRSFIHINDVSDGTYKACLHGNPSEIFHLSTSENISIRALVEKIAKKMNVSFDDHVKIVGERLGKDGAYLLDNQKAKSELAWCDTIGIDQGIDETIQWVTQNIEVLKAQVMDYVHKP